MGERLAIMRLLPGRSVRSEIGIALIIGYFSVNVRGLTPGVSEMLFSSWQVALTMARCHGLY